MSKEKKDITYEEGLEKVTDYIIDMSYKDLWSELEWLLQQAYPRDKFIELLDDFNLDKDGKWEGE